jgi:hypothetical protein
MAVLGGLKTLDRSTNCEAGTFTGFRIAQHCTLRKSRR